MLGRLFGKKTAETERARADGFFDKGQLGAAKLAYEAALDLTAKDATEQRQALDARVSECLDGIARTRIVEAEALLSQGSLELALEELRGAADVARGAELLATIEARIEALERRDARANATIAEQSADERWETLSGSFEEAQLDEYAFHGEPLKSALLALSDGDAASARPLLERLAPEDGAACYVWFELGRARGLEGDSDGAEQAFARFLEGLPSGQGGETRLLAHMELATMRFATQGFEGACAQYEAAIDAMPDDPRPYLAMAGFFRREGLHTEAIEVLHAACDALEGDQRPWRLTQELGLAHAAAGHVDQAVELLEEVVAWFVARQHLDLPAEAATRLAALHEQRGNPGRALDLYSLLTDGSDVGGHFRYHREAARLLEQLGHRGEARRMLQRALELAPEDPALRAEVAAKIEALR
jgi:tetratricopeptide (TPR) repeat protein